MQVAPKYCYPAMCHCLLQRLLLVGMFCVMCSTALAGTYQLVPGDRLWLRHSGQMDRISVDVDIDGDMRVPEYGAIPVAQLDLKTAEQRLRKVLERSQLFVDPRVELVVARYAPVVVAGEVALPGRFDFSAGLTVAAAVAMAGGLKDGLMPRRERDILVADLAGRKRGFELAIAAQKARIARLEAQLDDTDPLQLLGRKDPLPAFWALEIRTLNTEQKQVNKLLSQWRAEITALQRHRNVTKARLAEQKKIVTMAERTVETSRALQRKQLQVAAQVAQSERVLANARQDVLELESLLVASEAAVAKTRLARDRYLAQRADQHLTALHTSHLTLAEARENLRRVSDQLAVLNGRSAVEKARFQILSLRPGRQKGLAVTPATALLPGDTVIVHRAEKPAPADG